MEAGDGGKGDLCATTTSYCEDFNPAVDCYRFLRAYIFTRRFSEIGTGETYSELSVTHVNHIHRNSNHGLSIFGSGRPEYGKNRTEFGIVEHHNYYLEENSTIVILPATGGATLIRR
ncbi:jg1564 [Pararge aegeria aegeria]|uniref:Jg1564 protein n=1 Tax=Pararge aegeria aegeria TaxID=348720 RepID=A0A8S4RBY3_9NEOP|nr:jg1564 [Pararge aegeria aegeria]